MLLNADETTLDNLFSPLAFDFRWQSLPLVNILYTSVVGATSYQRLPALLASLYPDSQSRVEPYYKGSRFLNSYL
jgi:hypothetical protein